MTASAKDLMTIANNGTFQSRVQYFMQGYALTVMAEANTVTSHSLRVIYANKVLTGTANVVQYAVAVVTNSTITGEASLTGTDFSIPDSDIQFQVDSIFNSMAGVSN